MSDLASVRSSKELQDKLEERTAKRVAGFLRDPSQVVLARGRSAPLTIEHPSRPLETWEPGIAAAAYRDTDWFALRHAWDKARQPRDRGPVTPY